MRAGLAIAASVVLSAATSVVVNVLTDDWGLAWWVALGVLVLAAAVIAVWLGHAGSAATTGAPPGGGSVAVGGNAHGPISTKVRGTPAAGAGSVAVTGDAAAGISTDVDARDV
ncbi:hypothetical protein N8J89_23805 [Crossiella sp. CA-258035]|uniref:hypothetical protein n=1 Tax=Crossiella sp. CA-258035 TaxID=2981138 RepID=UPI0024BD43C2|nr:hypothetical protein [Crossiella sp. CA-258035]WHT16155.1 hypothetical protein N8J89_23805 [Crossiella sp. CA-258035]